MDCTGVGDGAGGFRVPGSIACHGYSNECQSPFSMYFSQKILGLLGVRLFSTNDAFTILIIGLVSVVIGIGMIISIVYSSSNKSK